MGDFEHGYCSIEEYVADSFLRVHEEELVQDELYTAVFALRKSFLHKKAAAKLLSRVSTISQLELDPEFYSVEFVVYGSDLNPTVRERAIFRDGFWLPAISMPLTVGKQNVIGGYFKEYQPDLEQELAALTRNIPVNPAYSA